VALSYRRAEITFILARAFPILLQVPPDRGSITFYTIPVEKTLPQKTVTYATKQLTEALQELERSRHFNANTCTKLPDSIPTEKIEFSKEVENFLENKRAYSSKTREISVGNY